MYVRIPWSLHCSASHIALLHTPALHNVSSYNSDINLTKIFYYRVNHQCWPCRNRPETPGKKFKNSLFKNFVWICQWYSQNIQKPPAEPLFPDNFSKDNIAGSHGMSSLVFQKIRKNPLSILLYHNEGKWQLDSLTSRTELWGQKQ